MQAQADVRSYGYARGHPRTESRMLPCARCATAGARQSGSRCNTGYSTPGRIPDGHPEEHVHGRGECDGGDSEAEPGALPYRE